MKYVATAGFFAIVFSLSANATIYQFSTNAGQFEPGVSNRGWWSDTAPNSSDNDNTFTGDLSGNINTRGFFTFDLRGFALNSGEKIVTATLSLFTDNVIVSNTDSSNAETLGFYDVVTSAAALNNNVGPSGVIFDDLGSGIQYATQDYTTSDSNSLILTSLNAAAISDIEVSVGDYFSIGAALLTDDLTGNAQGVFGFSDSTDDQLLIIETATIPLPTPAAMLAGACIASVLLGSARRWKPADNL